MIVLHYSENRMIAASFVRTKHRNVTEGQTDRQTDWAMTNTAVAFQAMPTCRKNHIKTKNEAQLQLHKKRTTVTTNASSSVITSHITNIIAKKFQ